MPLEFAIGGMAPVTQLTTTPRQPAIGDDVVLLSVPADGGYLGVLRTATAGLAARLHFALDDIEDLRIAVDEACAMLLVVATRDAQLECRFTVTDDALTVAVTVPTASGARLPAESSFAWKVLTALTTTATAETTGRHATIRLLTRRLGG
jgi:serine/threonine-protein kinase RsbW